MAYSTVNHHRSSISKFHEGFAGHAIGSHPLVSKAVKAVFRLRPPLPKYRSTFDISKVFLYLLNQPNNDNLSLKQLTYKTLFLLISASISRVSSVSRLGTRIQFNEDSCVIDLITLEKQGRPGHVRGYISVRRFHDNLKLCPVSALQEYVNRVCSFLFIANK